MGVAAAVSMLRSEDTKIPFSLYLTDAPFDRKKRQGCSQLGPLHSNRTNFEDYSLRLLRSDVSAVSIS